MSHEHLSPAQPEKEKSAEKDSNDIEQMELDIFRESVLIASVSGIFSIEHLRKTENN